MARPRKFANGRRKPKNGRRRRARAGQQATGSQPQVRLKQVGLEIPLPVAAADLRAVLQST